MEHHSAGRLAEAESLYRQALDAEPDNPETLHLLGAIALRAGNHDLSVQFIERAIRIRPESAVYLNSIGEAYRAQGRLYEAVDSFNRALAIKPDYVEALYNRSLAFNGLRRYHDALASCDEAIKIRPGLAEAFGSRGIALEGLGRYEEAVASYDRAIEIRPELAEGWNNRGLALGKARRFDEALASFGKALAVRSDYAEAHNNLGNALRDLGRLREAEDRYRIALTLNPGLAEVHNNLGMVLRDLGRLSEAEEALRRALALKPDHVSAHCALGNVLFYLGRLQEAEQYFRGALARQADCLEAYAFWVHLCQHLCAFPDVKEHSEALRRRIADDKSGEVAPFMFSALPGTSAGEQHACAGRHAERNFSGFFARPIIHGGSARSDRGKLRIGYASADYHEHATSYLLAEVIELHDRSRFEPIGYSYGLDDGGPMRRRMRAAFDAFHDIRGASYEAAAQQIFDDGIDILVDLKGYTAGSRVQIDSLQPAPVQVSWLGYPGTLGDRRLAGYLIGDTTVTPPAHASHYSETLVLMPHCYQPNDRRRMVGARPSRGEAGLPDKGFVFCAFTQSYKITQEAFEIWCRLLGNVPGSVLWLLQPNPVAQVNLRREAQARGIAADRLVFAPPLRQAEHLGRLQLADLALDTFPYTSHTTASDAIWVDVPLVSRIGETFVSRVAASILNAAGLPELVTQNFDAYFRTALELASHPDRLKQMRTKLQSNKMACPLFDSKRFSRNLERAYERIWADHNSERKERILVVAE